MEGEGGARTALHSACSGKECGTAVPCPYPQKGDDSGDGKGASVSWTERPIFLLYLCMQSCMQATEESGKASKAQPSKMVDKTQRRGQRVKAKRFLGCGCRQGIPTSDTCGFLQCALQKPHFSARKHSHLRESTFICRKSYEHNPRERKSGEIFADTSAKRSEILAKYFADVRPLISWTGDRKNFHEKISSKYSARDEAKFFHCEILGVMGPKKRNSSAKTLSVQQNASFCRKLLSPFFCSPAMGG